MSNGVTMKGMDLGSSDPQSLSAARARLKSASLNHVDWPNRQNDDTCQYQMFVGTWNVGGKTPNNRLNLQDFLQVEESPDIYVLGFQEIVPLTAGNVLVVEDNEPASRWLALIHQALNEPQEQPDEDDDPPPPEPPPPDARRHHHLHHHHHHHRRRDSSSLFFQTPSLKVLSNSYRVDSALVKTCNCSAEPSSMRRRAAEVRAAVYRAEAAGAEAADAPSTSAASAAAETTSACSEAETDGGADGTPPANCDPAAAGGGGGGMSYCLIASKQMVGLFLSVWVKRELVEHVGHLRVDCVGRGIMGWLGNKGCIAISMTLHRTSLCFVCSHLASGEKEGDELRRNADVAEILRSAHFPRPCKAPGSHRVPEKIMDHDRMIWLGDLNYRVSLSYEETRTLLEENDWDTLLEKDQLLIEREAGRVFRGWKEGKICFAPTYKYTQNSDAYAGETAKSKKKRRTPAWCDRILWHGDGIEQLQYQRGESRFSDHRPVCGVFAVEVDDDDGSKIMRSYYSVNARMGHDRTA
ncbi:unnamed protein product [Urochloa decumbens]|uniref:Inositol polyphosphate-related phosphatase domain-containing protein n=1 Tax=Urochloa decumbens TaxID=240449 RepID=A0ABC9DW35_9POAL